MEMGCLTTHWRDSSEVEPTSIESLLGISVQSRRKLMFNIVISNLGEKINGTTITN